MGLKAIWMGDDTGFPDSFKIIDKLKKRAGDIPLLCECSYPELEKALTDHTLTGGVFYYVNEVPDADTANRCMDRVRSFSP